MTVRILDQASLPALAIHKMQEHIQNTLAEIQVDVKWINCAVDIEACKPARGRNEFWLRILAKIPADAGNDQIGFAQPEGVQCVNVFYPVIEGIVRSFKVDRSRVLAAAAVHEIGHLYLGDNRQAHSLNGVMNGTWSRQKLDEADALELKFVGNQGARIRTAMQAGIAQSNPSGLR